MNVVPRHGIPRRDIWTPARVKALGLTIDIETAGNVLGIGRTSAYQLAKNNQFPVPVIRAGTQYRVPTYGLLEALCATADENGQARR